MLHFQLGSDWLDILLTLLKKCFGNDMNSTIMPRMALHHLTCHRI